MADNVSKEAQDILQNSARHINCLSDENKNVRKRALQGLQKDTLIDVSEPRVLQLVFNEISKPLLKVVSDPVEKCRELAISYLTTAIQKIQNIQDFLPYIIPVFVQRYEFRFRDTRFPQIFSIPVLLIRPFISPCPKNSVVLRSMISIAYSKKLVKIATFNGGSYERTHAFYSLDERFYSLF